ncbi:sigma-70 family RNA polymerase sigma factor [Planctomyces sp. SH-PL14]|uniref:sigma-70 family RNA polymerase sigma factor n=1 Tax=Planctomyces sp. SH-PL14 TaxID=1632864 RepID=UPI00078CFE19|nr:sigma-70 family RNA polymerase sigma factor [Planctomyces sp. SH-PL14]AMV18550.1 RNA polymerase sigma factor SigL [Planctomyces sp. SH-PL14]
MDPSRSPEHATEEPLTDPEGCRAAAEPAGSEPPSPSFPDGDPPGGAFAGLIVKHDRALLRYIMTLIPRRDDAEEILQRTAATLWEHFPQYDRTRPFLPWALRFAYFEVLNFRKEMARDRLVFREDVLALIAETRGQLEPELDARRAALRSCLDRLAPADLSLLRRRYCDSSSVGTLAEEAGKTAKALYRRLDRIRELVWECVTRRMAHQAPRPEEGLST